MSEIKQLAGQTLLYGLSTVVPRFLNWLLVPYYTYNFAPAEYGVVTELYAYVTFFIIILTYGMETAFFRFYKKYEGTIVYHTLVKTISFTSIIFVLLVFLFIDPISSALQYDDYQYYLQIFALILALDAVVSIPFAKLRADEKPVRFAGIKIVNVSVNIFFNILFITILPIYQDILPPFIYNPDIGVGYIFISNLIASFFTLLLLRNHLSIFNRFFDVGLLKKAFLYGIPLLFAGLAGNINEALDRIILKHYLPGEENAMEVLGIYGANIKISVLMLLFIQMFKYAFEPYFFKKGDSKLAENQYADILKYFIIAAIFIFLSVNFYIDLIKYFISPSYWKGLSVVPIIMFSYLLYGIFINLSVWYKLKNITLFGALLTLVGAGITLLLNISFIPLYGYFASAWTRVLCYGVMVLLSYFLSRKYMPIPYDVSSIFLYLLTGAFLFFTLTFFTFDHIFLHYIVKTLALLLFILLVMKKEKISLSQWKSK